MKPDKKYTEVLKFTKLIASLTEGCAPSAGYMEELIKRAKKALKHFENESSTK